MGVAHSKDGAERSTFARVLDPNGLVLEAAAGWESGELEETARAVEDARAAEPCRGEYLALHIAEPPDDDGDAAAARARDVDGQEDAKRRAEEQCVEPPPGTIVEQGLLKVAPPSLVRWLADAPAKDLSGEQLYEHRRTRITRDDNGFGRVREPRV